MRTVGQYLKQSRVRKKMSIGKLESVTKIKRGFLESIEKEDWGNLPEYPVVVGFVKNFASAISINEGVALSLLRRDYPPKDLSVNPKPDVVSRFSWSPKATFYLGVFLVVLAVLGYVSVQYFKFKSPPSLVVTSPMSGAVVTQKEVLVVGTTDSDAKVTVNNQPTLINGDGDFTVLLKVDSQTKEVVIKSTSRSGLDTTIIRNIEVSP